MLTNVESGESYFDPCHPRQIDARLPASPAQGWAVVVGVGNWVVVASTTQRVTGVIVRPGEK